MTVPGRPVTQSIDRSRTGLTRVLTWIVMTLALVAVLLVVVFVTLGPVPFFLARHFFIPEEAIVELPDKHVITYWRRGAHPFLAEYTRGVTLSDGWWSKAFHPLMIDIGKGTRVNVYWIEENGRNLVRFDDEMAEHLYDVDEDKMYWVFRAGDRAFAAPLTRENPDTEPTNSPTYAPVRVDGKLSVRLDSKISDTHGRYLGVFHGGTNQLRFFPYSDRAEEPIVREPGL